ncbi:MAG: hypothetical protein M1812_003349 [Candelaria pacifica]|nr:MAG: hypothetical protein M1812_003349 [Candelaria pacifica]
MSDLAMSAKLIPHNPESVMVIRKVTPNIITCSAPFLRFGRFKIGGRGTIVRLSSGSLAVFSPTALTPEVRETVSNLGDNVGYLVALDSEHHIYLGQWYQAFPQAKVVGPEGLPEKRAKQKNETIPFSTVFKESDKANQSIGADFDQDFDYEYVGSHASKELVFNYRPDKTLVVGDYMFNLPAYEQYSRAGERADSGILTKLFVAMVGTAQGPATWQKRFLWYAASAKDRPAFAKSTERIDKFNFERIIPCHGDVMEKEGHGIFRKVFEWHLQAKK